MDTPEGQESVRNEVVPRERETLKRPRRTSEIRGALRLTETPDVRGIDPAGIRNKTKQNEEDGDNPRAELLGPTARGVGRNPSGRRTSSLG